jgi:Zn-finger nucleic acid-binding protein
MFAERSSYDQSYTMLSALVVVMVVVVLFHRHTRHDSPTENKKRNIQRYTVGSGGSEAGVFWSGAMRCPKCRADMEQIDYEGTEIDRCVVCKGIWFDEGEIDVFGDQQAAAAIDIGNVKTGKQHNVLDSYQCPRCSAAMVKVVDPARAHIWYETCTSCNGSYLDAGELSTL